MQGRLVKLLGMLGGDVGEAQGESGSQKDTKLSACGHFFADAASLLLRCLVVFLLFH